MLVLFVCLQLAAKLILGLLSNRLECLDLPIGNFKILLFPLDFALQLRNLGLQLFFAICWIHVAIVRAIGLARSKRLHAFFSRLKLGLKLSYTLLKLLTSSISGGKFDVSFVLGFDKVVNTALSVSALVVALLHGLLVFINFSFQLALGYAELCLEGINTVLETA